MAPRGRFLSSAYGAYFHRNTPSEDEELTHVGPGTPCGEYLRRFWQPIAYISELKDVALPVRILGEDLVIFQDRSGRVGLLERHCAHRGTSLEFGRIAECGIRCCYHGWLFDVDGKILETPTEPSDSTLKDRLYHGAYPTLEYRGVVFAYMGPPDRRPTFPIYDVYATPGYRTVPLERVFLPCNWLQIKENVMDPFHSVFLHVLISGSQFGGEWGNWRGAFPHLEWRETEIGMISLAARRDGGRLRVRINDLILPNIHQIPRDSQEEDPEKFPIELPLETKWAVPVDDTNTMLVRLLHVDERMLDKLTTEEQDRVITMVAEKANFGEALDRPYEVRQRAPADYDAQVSQRPIAIHALEHLGATDRGVIMYRKLLRQGIDAVRKGNDPKGVSHTDAGTIETFSHGRLLRVPSTGVAEADRRALEEVTRVVAETPSRHAASVVSAT